MKIVICLALAVVCFAQVHIPCESPKQWEGRCVRGTEYRFNQRTRQCNVTNLSLPFRKVGVPQGARYLSKSELGNSAVPGMHLTAIVYYGYFEDGAEYVATVTNPDCLPLSLDVQSKQTEEYYHESYYDVQVGLSEGLNTFNLHRECHRIPDSHWSQYM